MNSGPFINRWYWQFRIEDLPYTCQGSMPAESEAEALEKVKTELQREYPGKKLMMEEFWQERERTDEDWLFFSPW